MFFLGSRPLISSVGSSLLRVPRTAFRPQTGLRFASSKNVAVEPLMPWNEFFKLRKQRRAYALASSVFTSIIASGGAFEYFANLVIDFNKTLMGIEIQWWYIGGIITSGFLGWVVGPFFGNKLFTVMLGSRRASFVKMDDVFLRHIVRNRPDPSRHNVNTNPLPDYYGEKIGSMNDYRQWLREVRLFERKAKNFL